MTTERCPPPEGCEIEEDTSREPESVALAERLEYLMVVAASLVAGGRITASDVARLRRLCHDLELPERVTDSVLSAAHFPDVASRHCE